MLHKLSCITDNKDKMVGVKSLIALLYSTLRLHVMIYEKEDEEDKR